MEQHLTGGRHVPAGMHPPQPGAVSVCHNRYWQRPDLVLASWIQISSSYWETLLWPEMTERREQLAEAEHTEKLQGNGKP